MNAPINLPQLEVASAGVNNQPVEKPNHNASGEYLDVVKVWPTLQGEGPFVGTPAVFIRLAGCNLQCPMCDTDYTAGRQVKSVREIVLDVHKVRESGVYDLIVITGGEPFRQKLGPLVRALNNIDRDVHVQIETNGTLYYEDFPWYSDVSVVCSPKTPKVNEELARHVLAWKYVVRAGEVSEEDGLPVRVLGGDCDIARPPKGQKRLVYVQPAQETNRTMADEFKQELNLQAAIESCRKFGYRLSLQVHKLLGLE